MLSQEQSFELAEWFKLLGDQTRLRIVLFCIDSETPVSEIAEHVGASVSLVSHHLRLLRAARLVRSRRDGKQIYYQLADDHVKKMLNEMVSHVRECDVE